MNQWHLGKIATFSVTKLLCLYTACTRFHFHFEFYPVVKLYTSLSCPFIGEKKNHIRARTHTHTKRYSEAIWKTQPFERVSVMSIFPQNGNSRHTQTRLFVKANLCFRLLDVARENKADWSGGDEERTDEHREKGNYRSESGGFVTKRQHWRVLCSLWLPTPPPPVPRPKLCAGLKKTVILKSL